MKSTKIILTPLSSNRSITTTIAFIDSVLEHCKYDIESDMVGVDYNQDGVYLYAFFYFDGSCSDIAMMINDVKVVLTAVQKEHIFKRLGRVAKVVSLPYNVKDKSIARLTRLFEGFDAYYRNTNQAI